MQARAVALKTRPEGMPTADNFQIIDIDVPEPVSYTHLTLPTILLV